MTRLDLAKKADAFRALHIPAHPFVLFNAWDAGSARAVAAAGARAIGTGSWSVAAAHGWSDGEQVPLEFALANAARMAAATPLPLTVDLESGYSAHADGVADVLARAVAAGAIGCNLEDSLPGSKTLRSPQEQAERLRAARRGADTAGVPAFINARTDLFLASPRDTHDLARVDLAVERARHYADAGADGFFVPGLVDLRLIARIVEGTRLPVNVMMQAGLPSRRELADAGVARISHGPGPFIQLMAQLTAAAKVALGDTAASSA